jgi:hypothetical protein
MPKWMDDLYVASGEDVDLLEFMLPVMDRINKLLEEAAFDVNSGDLHDRLIKEIQDA